MMISNQIYSKKTNNTYLMQQNHHQILENNGCQWREREAYGKEKKKQYKIIKSR